MAQKSMSLEEKLDIIDREISAIHHCFVRRGFTPLEIEHGARPLLKCVALASKKRLAVQFMKLALFVAAVVFIFRTDPVYMLFVSYGRLFATKVLYPYWDFTPLHQESCMWNNPYYVPTDRLKTEDCEKCDTLDFIPRAEALTQKMMNEDFLKQDVPVIVTDAMKNWPAMKDFNIQYLAKVFTSDPDLKLTNGCSFTSNLRTANGNNRLFLLEAADENINNFYGYWENCLDKSMKAMRNYFSRPYFIPPSATLTSNNWVFISSNYKSKTFKVNPLISPMIWYAQITGETEIRLSPKVPCNENRCQELRETLKAGEILVLTEMLWDFDFMPGGGKSGESIAIGGGGIFD